MNYSDIPRDEWIALAEQQSLKRTYRVYLFKRNWDGTRTALKGGTFHKVPEGHEMPVYIELSDQLKHFMSAFKHAYVIEENLQEWSEHVANNR